MNMIHIKYVARSLKAAGLHCRYSRSGLSLVIYREPRLYFWAPPSLWTIGHFPIQNDCVRKADVEAATKIRLRRFG